MSIARAPLVERSARVWNSSGLPHTASPALLSFSLPLSEGTVRRPQKMSGGRSGDGRGERGEHNPPQTSTTNGWQTETRLRRADLTKVELCA